MPEIRPGNQAPVRVAVTAGEPGPRTRVGAEAGGDRVLPQSYITAESEGLVEEFLVRRRLGGLRIDELCARQAEGFLILEQELSTEIKDGQQHTRHAL